MLQVTVFLTFLGAVWTLSDSFTGCFEIRDTTRTHKTLVYPTPSTCMQECKSKFYRYAMVNADCICGNYLGTEVNSTVLCKEICPTCNNLTDVYATGIIGPGPPENVQITNITERSIHISWEKPKSYTEITGYTINAYVLHTYAKYMPTSPVWTYTNDTFRTKLILLAATKYNITLRANSLDGFGIPFSRIIETQVGEPENLPEPPTILKKYSDKIEIKIPEISNSNGPITGYIVVVVNDENRQVFQEHFLKGYHESRQEEVNYYIAAELKPESIERNFIVGDGRSYNGYYNAPLQPDVSYSIMTGIVSRFNGVTKKAFSSLESLELYENKEIFSSAGGDNPAVIIGLSVAIGLLSFMLIAGIVGFIILKNRVTNNRHRLSDNQELTLQGPIIEVENNGYIPEEEPTKANHYKNLKEKLRTIPYNQLKIEPTNLLGVGRYGRVNSGSVYENNSLVPVAAYTIQDKKLNPEEKRSMLKDLDVLIKTGKHDNIVSLIGTCETSQILVVVLEYVSMNLKDLLLGSRDSLPVRFSNMTENQALEIAINIAKGMAHLESNKIMHRQLCARNILIANGFIPKINGYGLAQYHNHNNLPDYTRWMALEVLRGQPHNAKSDVWSFGCLLWETCVLGGTPYGSFSNNEVPDQIMRGLRLPQMQYFSDELYQVMLDCWQIDMDERPVFAGLVETLQALQMNALIPSLSFNLYSNFQYEQFYPDMEVAVRPVL